MSHLPEVDESTFEAEVIASELPVLLDFTATWCGPCRALEPILQGIARDRAGALRVLSVDGDEAQAIATRYGVRSYPTMLLFARGQVVARQVGLTSRARILEMMDEALAPATA